MDTKKLMKQLMEMTEDYMQKLLFKSWCLQQRDERKARLAAVMELSVELDKIRRVNQFGTGLAETVLENIIQGEWERAHEGAQLFRFNEENQELRNQFAPLWNKFVVLTEAACVLTRVREQVGSVKPS